VISGEASAPAGDGAPNLLKYYFGLPAKTPVPADRLPKGALLTRSNQLFLTVSFERDVGATDVDCVSEVSTDLVNWSSGPGETTVDSIINLGTRERVTLRDLTPVSVASARFLRLRLTRRPA